MRWFTSLLRSSAFSRVRRRGRSAVLETLTAYGAERRPGPPRIGVSVGAALGGAVVRNRIRRRVHGALEALSGGPAPLPRNGEFVFVARPPAAAASYAALAGDVAAGLARVASGS